MSGTADTFDYIIVGAGSAGCVLANRLSADPKNRVLLLEAGGSDINFWIWMPIGYGKAFYDKRINWAYTTEPDPGTNDRVSYWPRGKVLGGSSSINAMVYIRGQQADFDEWESRGNPGWGWSDVLPFFKKAENNDRGGDEWRGQGGPLHVATLNDDYHPLCDAFIQAGIECGLSHNPDFNGASQEGIGLYQNTARNGFRMSASRAYLRPVASRRNLTVECHAHVSEIMFQGRRATGVRYHKGRNRRKVLARREIIVSAGAVNSPQLLQLSGVGPANLLQSLGVDVVTDLPAVGQNLQDHIGVDYVYRSSVPTLNDQLRPMTGKLRHGLEYVLSRRGPLSLGVNQGGGFFKTRSDLANPNVQLYFSPVSYTKAPPGIRPLMQPDNFSGFLMGVQPTRPRSTGSLEITSLDPLVAPAIKPAYLSDEEDMVEMIDAVRFLRTLSNTNAMRRIIDREVVPGVNVESVADLVADIRARATTVFHPVSTCRMGPDRSRNVVDHRLRVHGLSGLRVADASVFPAITSGNTNAPAIMVGEKAAAMIIEDQR